MPRRVPELLMGIARRGDAGRHRVDRGPGWPFWQPPSNTHRAQERGAQEASGIRVAFPLDTFFSTAWRACPALSGMQELEQCRSNCRGEAKESTSLVGARTDIKSTIALAIPNQ